jgi:hypothetical protein
MSTNWPRRVNHLNGPRLWITRSTIDRMPGFNVIRISDEKYRRWIAHLAGLSGLVEAGDNTRYHARLRDQVDDTMIDLAFLNMHGEPSEGFVDPPHWPKPE